jgi:hypothetical protein
MRHNTLYLTDIVEAEDHIAEFIAGTDPGQFQESELLRSAVVHKLSVIGEAAARLSDDLRARNPQAPGRRSSLFETSWCMRTSGLIGTSSGPPQGIAVLSCAPRLPGSSQQN